MAEVLYFPKSKCLHYLTSTPINLQLVRVEMETNGKKCLRLSVLFSMYIYSLMLLCCLLLTNCITFKLIPLFTRLIQDIRIIYIYLQLDLLQYKEVLFILLVRYSTNYHPESHDLRMIRQFLSLLWGNIFLSIFYSIEEFLSHEQL
jgi:hypothetical protein